MKTYENTPYNVHKRTYTKIFLIVKNLKKKKLRSNPNVYPHKTE